jgi:ATP-dependent Zn protease
MSPVTTEPVQGLRPPGEGPDGRERPTRKPLRLFDRVKFLLLFVIVRIVLVWSAMADTPIITLEDAVKTELRSRQWWYWLFFAEILRQIHYLISERSAGYHRFWTHTFFGGFERGSQRRLSAWTRFRIARVIKWMVWIAAIAIIIGAVVKTSPVLALFQLPALLWQAAPMLLQVVFIMFIAVGQFVAIFWFMSRGGVDVYYPDDIKTRFTDVWGQDHVLARVRENIMYLEKPEEIESKGGYVPGGILLWGPPGTGKTLMAEAVAGETGRPYVFVDPGAFTNMFMGVGILKVKGLFRKLRKLALRYGGVIVFFDEADSLGNRGSVTDGGPGFPRGMTPAPWTAAGCNGFSYLSPDAQWHLLRERHRATGVQPPTGRRDKVVMGNMGMGGGGGMGTLQALLTEMSGLKKPRGFINRHVRRALGMRPKPPPKYRILVMMATNLPEALDPALLRPGRIDRIYKVGYPSKVGRVRTYEGYFDKVRHELTPENMDKLAVMTPYATGATIKDMVNEALVTAIRDGREVIGWGDVMKAKQLKDLGPPQDVEYIERERHAVAVHEACHAVIAYRVRRHLVIDIATIEKGADYLGMVAGIPPEDLVTQWRTDYESDLLVSLASLAGERMFFENDNSSGVSGDLSSATLTASFMEGYWGMGSTISSHGAGKLLETGAPGGGLKKDTGEAMRRALADRIEDKLNEMMERVQQLLKENRREVLSLAHALETYKTMHGDDVAAVIETRRGPLVDGTPYGNAEFFAEIEAYHVAAMAAHKERTKLDSPLPVLPSLAPPVPALVGAFTIPGQAIPPNGPFPAGQVVGPVLTGPVVSSGLDRLTPPRLDLSGLDPNEHAAVIAMLRRLLEMMDGDGSAPGGQH